MKQLPRYTWKMGGMAPRDDGDYVKYEAVQRLFQELADTAEELVQLKKSLGLL